MGHSYDQRPIHTEPDQRAMIQKSVKTIKQFTGKQPASKDAFGNEVSEKLLGTYRVSKARPSFMQRLIYFGLEREWMQALEGEIA